MRIESASDAVLPAFQEPQPYIMSSLLNAVLSDSNLGVLITDNDGTIRYINSRLEQITGYSEAELIGNNPKLLQSGETPKATYLEMWNSLSSGHPWRGTLRNRRKDGRRYWESISIIPAKDSRGAITNYVGLVEDITERKNNDDDAERVNREIARQERVEGFTALAATIAHELSNTLTLIIGNLILAREDCQPYSAVQTRLREALIATTRLSTLTADFQRYSGAVLSERTICRLDQAVEKILDPLLDSVPSTNPFLFMKSGTNLTTKVASDMLDATVKVLFQHALSVAEPGESIRLSVGEHSSEDEAAFEEFLNCGASRRGGCFIELSTERTGFDEETCRQLFDPYFSPGSSTTERIVPRSQIGLALTVGAVRYHKGRLLFRSSPGQGTVIRIIFPVAKGTNPVD